MVTLRDFSFSLIDISDRRIARETLRQMNLGEVFPGKPSEGSYVVYSYDGNRRKMVILMPNQDLGRICFPRNARPIMDRKVIGFNYLGIEFIFETFSEGRVL